MAERFLRRAEAMKKELKELSKLLPSEIEECGENEEAYELVEGRCEGDDDEK